jgi:hypothetical protein
VDNVSFAEQELGQIGAVLTGYAADQSNLVKHSDLFSCAIEGLLGGAHPAKHAKHELITSA